MREILCTVFWGKKTTRQATVSVADSCRFLNRQKAAQKPPGVRKIAERRRSSWRRATARVCKQTVPGARIPDSTFLFRVFRRAGILLYAQIICVNFLRIFVLRGKSSGVDPSARSGGRKDSIFLRPISEEQSRNPCNATCGWFWVPFAIKRYKTGNRSGCLKAKNNGPACTGPSPWRITPAPYSHSIVAGGFEEMS